MTSTPTKPVDNVVIAAKGLQDRNTNVTAGTTVENKGKLILTKVLEYSSYKHLKMYLICLFFILMTSNTASEGINRRFLELQRW